MIQGLTVLLDADIGRFQSAMQSASSSLANFGQKAQQFGQTFSLAISAPLALFSKQAISTYADMDSLRRGLATLEKDAGALQSRLTKLNEIAKMPGIGMKEAIAGDIRLRTVFNSIYGIDKAATMSERTLKSFGNAVALVGKGRVEFDRALYGIQQLANTPFPLGEDLNIIKDAIPQVTPILNQAFGTSRSDDFKKLGISSKQLTETILAGLEALPKASGGAKNGFENFGDTVTKSLDKVGGALFKALHVDTIFGKIADTIESLADKFANLPAPMQTLIGSFGAILVIVPPLIAGIGFFTTTILPQLKAGMMAVRAAAVLMTGPFGLIAAAVAVAATLIIMHWDRIKAALVSTGVWEQLKGIVKSALGVITSIFGVFANLLQGDWGQMWEHIKNIFKYTWNGLVSLVGAGVLAMGGIIAKGLAVIGLDSWAKGIEDKMNGVSDFIKNVKFDVPEARFNMFEGFNFGGEEVAKGKARPGELEKKKKEKTKKEKDPKEDMSILENLQLAKKLIEEEMQDIRSKGRLDLKGKLSFVVPDDLSQELKVVDRQIRRITGEDEPKPIKLKVLGENLLSKNIADTQARWQKFTDALKGKSGDVAGYGSLDFFSKEIDKIQRQLQRGFLKEGGIIDATKVALMVEYRKEIDKAAVATARLNLAADSLDLSKTFNFKEIGKNWSDQAVLAADQARQSLILGARDMTIALQSTLRSGASSAAEAMGGFVAGLLDGTKGIADLGPTILGAVADMLQNLATTLAASGAFLLFVNPLQGAAQLATAAGLFGVAQAAKAYAQPKRMAAGGYATGPTYSLTGEYSGANLHRRGEFVAPVQKGARLLVEEMIAQGGLNGGGGGVLTTRVAGKDLLFILERAKTDSRHSGGGR